MSVEPQPARWVGETAHLECHGERDLEQSTAHDFSSHIKANSLIFRDWTEPWVPIEATVKDVCIFWALRIRMCVRSGTKNGVWLAQHFLSLCIYVGIFSKYTLNHKEARTSLLSWRSGSLSTPSTQRPLHLWHHYPGLWFVLMVVPGYWRVRLTLKFQSFC